MTEDQPSFDGNDQPVVAEFSSGEGRARGPIIAMWVAVFVLIAGGAVVAWAMLQDDVDPLQAIPSDVDMVVTVDLLQLTDSDRIDSLVSTFAEPMADAGYIESSDVDLGGQLDQALREELDVSLEEDVLPWVGRSLAIGAWVPPDFMSVDGPDFVLSMSIRDGEAAAEFIQSVGEPVEVTAFEDGTLYTPPEETVGPLVIWVGGDLLVMASNRSTLRQALDSRDGGSVSGDEDFTQALDMLPSDRLGVFYAGSSFFESFAQMATGTPGLDLGTGPTEDLRGFAVSVSLPDAGLQFDSVQLLADGASGSPIAPSDNSSVLALSSNTLGFAAFAIAEGQVQEWLEQFRDTDPDFYDQLAAETEAELGVDVFGEVLPSIGGDSLIAVVQDRDGMLARESQLPLGVLVSLGLIDTKAVNDLVASVESLGPEQGVEIRGGDPSVAVIEGSEILAYQVTDDALVAGTSASVVEEFLGGTGGLVDTPLYRDLDSQLRGDGLALFVDMARIFDLAEMSPDDRAIARPIQGLGASYEVADDSISASFLIAIDYLDD